MLCLSVWIWIISSTMELTYAENPKPFRLFRFGNGIQIYHADKRL